MLHTFFTLLADATPAASPASGPASILSTPIVPIICLVAIFYFLAIRPQNQKQKQLQALINAVKTGDRVVTSSGIHGMISNVKETTVILKIADNVKIEIDKSSIGTVKRDDAEPAAAS
jgi:preprotein translocase subunit YajC